MYLGTHSITIFNASVGIASEGLKARVFEVALADLQSETDAERAFRKFKLISEDIQVFFFLEASHWISYIPRLPLNLFSTVRKHHSVSRLVTPCY